MAELSKYNVGDEVTVRGKVIEPSDDRPLVLFDQRLHAPGWQFYAHDSSIDKHTPKPREFKVGDKVTSADMGPHVYEITKIEKGIVALFRWTPAGSPPDVGWAYLSDLRHAEPQP